MRVHLMAATMIWAAWCADPVYGHPEFQIFSQANSGRIVNCAMCHAHADGPEGVKPGQVGSLSPEEQMRLAEARAAFEPGKRVKSPILNEFGNHIVSTLGKKRILEIRLKPELLSEFLGDHSDLDDDGIPDSVEYLQGTNPLSNQHGDPWTLFTVNLRREAFHIVMLFVATVLGLYGLNHLLRWFAQLTEPFSGEGEEEGTTP